MSFPLPIADELRRAAEPGASVLLGISGGVDSAVSLAVLQELGCEVHTVTFKNFCYAEQESSEKACCSVEAIQDARALAVDHGVHHAVRDVAPAFAAQVIQPFIDEYAAARTPNPCLGCNSLVRFPELVRLADQLGCDLVATGHYARTIRAPGGSVWLHRGVDPDKDQSYFLSHVGREVWTRVVFPLGWSRKPVVREAARRLGFTVADRPESQEICFVPDGDRSFLFPNGSMGAWGPIVDTGGRLLGEHRGLGRYTVGQRRGLNIAHTEPLYVVALEPAENRLVVGTREETAVWRLECDGYRPQDPRYADGGEPAGDTVVTAQVRHRHRGARVAAWRRLGDRLDVDLAEPVHGVAPGQGLTLYEDDRVVACGRLVASSGAGDTERGEA